MSALSSTAAALDPALDRAFDEAVLRVGELAARLWEVRRAHRPVVVRTLLGRARLRCAGCRQPCPCPTLRAAGPI